MELFCCYLAPSSRLAPIRRGLFALDVAASELYKDGKYNLATERIEFCRLTK